MSYTPHAIRSSWNGSSSLVKRESDLDWNSEDEIAWVIKQAIYYPAELRLAHPFDEYEINRCRDTLFRFVKSYMEHRLTGLETQTRLSAYDVLDAHGCLQLFNDSNGISRIMWVTTHNIDSETIMQLLHFG